MLFSTSHKTANKQVQLWHHNQALNIKYLKLKNWPTNVTQKVIHKRYPKIDRKRYSTINPKTLLKKWPTSVTLKVIH